MFLGLFTHNEGLFWPSHNIIFIFLTLTHESNYKRQLFLPSITLFFLLYIGSKHYFLPSIISEVKLFKHFRSHLITSNPMKGIPSFKRIDPLYVVIQQLSEWVCWSVCCDPGGAAKALGVETEKGDSCRIVFVSVGQPNPRRLRVCRCSTSRNVPSSSLD